MKTKSTQAEFVGGPRDGERRKLDSPHRMVRFQVKRKGKPPVLLLYRRRAGRRSSDGAVLYDHLPNVQP